MIPSIEHHMQDLAKLCVKHGVARLDVFGSAVSGSFDQLTSDLDFIVEFREGLSLGPWLGGYFDFKKALEELFGLEVDLVMSGAPRNPYFKQAIESTRRTLFAA